MNDYKVGEILTTKYIKADDGQLYCQPIRIVRIATKEEYINDLAIVGKTPIHPKELDYLKYYEIQVD